MRASEETNTEADMMMVRKAFVSQGGRRMSSLLEMLSGAPEDLVLCLPWRFGSDQQKMRALARS